MGFININASYISKIAVAFSANSIMLSGNIPKISIARPVAHTVTMGIKDTWILSSVSVSTMYINLIIRR